MTTDEERELLDAAVDGFDEARRLAIEGRDPLASIALSLATAGRAVARGLLLELNEVDP